MEFFAIAHLYENLLMKSFLVSALFLFVLNNSQAQTPVSDSLKINCRGCSVYYIYIDGIKVMIPSSDSLKVLSIEEISFITGGLPTNFGDFSSSIIQINKPLPIPVIEPKVLNKTQKMETE